MGADYSFYVKTIETHARAFLTLNILAIGRVNNDDLQIWNLQIFKFASCKMYVRTYAHTVICFEIAKFCKTSY